MHIASLSAIHNLLFFPAQADKYMEHLLLHAVFSDYRMKHLLHRALFTDQFHGTLTAARRLP